MLQISVAPSLKLFSRDIFRWVIYRYLLIYVEDRKKTYRAKYLFYPYIFSVFLICNSGKFPDPDCIDKYVNLYVQMLHFSDLAHSLLYSQYW